MEMISIKAKYFVSLLFIDVFISPIYLGCVCLYNFLFPMNFSLRRMGAERQISMETTGSCTMFHTLLLVGKELENE